jgi:peptide/nickel transport system permease protein
VAGVSGGLVDSTIGRLIDLTLSFPSTLMLLALSSMGIAFLTDNLHVPEGDLANGIYVVVVLAAFGWPYVARLMRGQVLSLREREFVDAARLMGASKFRVYFKEILPNLWAPLMVIFTLTMPAYISAEAALSFLGVGIKPPTPTLGNLLNTSISYMTADFVFFFTPAFLIAVIVVSFNLLGDGLRDALDPKGDR